MAFTTGIIALRMEKKGTIHETEQRERNIYIMNVHPVTLSSISKKCQFNHNNSKLISHELFYYFVIAFSKDILLWDCKTVISGSFQYR